VRGARICALLQSVGQAALHRTSLTGDTTMATRKLDKAQWRVFFDDFSRSLKGQQAEIEVGSIALGNQVEAQWVTMYGITYDPKDDLVELSLEGLDHMIRKPQEIYVEGGSAGLESVEIIDAGGVRQIVRFRQPPKNPPTGF